VRVEDQRRIARRRVLLALSLERLEELPVPAVEVRVERGPSSAAPAAGEGRGASAG
jgi:hypothetical protein